MIREYSVVLLIIVAVILSILIFISKENIRKAFFVAITVHSVTWPIGLILVFLEKVEYPVRLFPKAIDSSFLHGYILNPVIYAIYYIHYPKGAKLMWKLLYTLFVSTIPVSLEVIENKYTNLIKYKDWSGYHTWILILIVFFIVNKYLNWFFKNVHKQGVLKNEA